MLFGLINFSVLLSFLLWIGVLLMRGLLGVVSSLLSLDFLDDYGYELSLLNDGKVGRPFKITYGYIVFLAVIRYLFSMPYRQIGGFTGALSRLILRFHQ
jgi:hypothetical protein